TFSDCAAAGCAANAASAKPNASTAVPKEIAFFIITLWSCVGSRISRAEKHRPGARLAFNERAQPRVRRLLERRIVRQDSLGDRFRVAVDRDVAHQVGDAKLGQAGLRPARKLARPAQAQIFL